MERAWRRNEAGPLAGIPFSVKDTIVTKGVQEAEPLQETLVVPVQNGVTAHEEIGAVIGSGHVVGGLVLSGLWLRTV